MCQLESLCCPCSITHRVTGLQLWPKSCHARFTACSEDTRELSGEATIAFWIVQVAVAPLQAYYKAAYAAVRRYSPHGWVVIAPRVYEQDGSEWQHFMTGSKYTRVLQDLHECVL